MLHPIRRLWLCLVAACWAPALLAESDDATHSLASVWNWSIDNQPLYLAGQLLVEAEEDELTALRRSTLPELQVEAGGDYGQRVSPGEERARGVTSRGEIVARVNWTLVDSGRTSSQRALERARAEAISQQQARDLSFRAEVARMYVSAAAHAERAAILHSADQDFNALTNALRRRSAEGVAPTDELIRAEQAASRRAVEQRETDDADRSSRIKLALLADQADVRPKWLELRAPAVRDPHPNADHSAEPASPLLTSLEQAAERQRADAEHLRRADQWRLDLTGQTGPYFSGALDDGRKTEYFAGLRLTWTPDLAGVNRSRSSAQLRRAESLEAERASLAQEFEREARQLQEQLRQLEARRQAQARLLERTADRERTESLRWREGVGDWSSLYSAREDLLNARLEELDWRLETALQLIDYAETTNRLDELPVWLGQQETTP